MEHNSSNKTTFRSKQFYNAVHHLRELNKDTPVNATMLRKIDAHWNPRYFVERKQCAECAIQVVRRKARSSQNFDRFSFSLTACFEMLLGRTVTGKRPPPANAAETILKQVSLHKGWSHLECEGAIERILLETIEQLSAKSNKKECSSESTVQDLVIPTSAILVAHLKNRKTNESPIYVVVSDATQQDTSQNTLWVGRALPSMMLAAMQMNPQRRFKYKGNDYQVFPIKEFPELSKYLGVIGRFCNPEAPQIVYVFSQKNIEHYRSDRYEEVTAMVPCAGHDFPVPITVIYEKDERKYFINESSYNLVRTRYGLPYIRLVDLDSDSSSSSFGRLKSQSVLNRLGYNVNMIDNLSIEERHCILRCAIETRTLTKAEVMNHLEWLINTRTHMDSMQHCVAEWRADLQFVSCYRFDNQRTIFAKSFVPRSK